MYRWNLKQRMDWMMKQFLLLLLTSVGLLGQNTFKNLKVLESTTLYGPGLADGNLTNSWDFDDLLSFEADSRFLNLTGIESAYLDGGITTVRGATNLNLWTPGITASTAKNGQFLQLKDEGPGEVEYANSITVVQNVAELVALTGNANRTARTLGYTTAGDGGGAVYRWTSDVTGTNAYGGKIAVTGGAWEQVDRPYSFFQFGVRSGDTAQSSNNAIRMTSALQWRKDGGHLVLPNLGQTVYLGPQPVRPGVHMTNVVLELHGNIAVPDSPTWSATHPSLFHFADAWTYNNLAINGTATIFGNATNQTTSAGNNYGKQNCFWIGNSTNLLLDGLTIKGFGNFAVLVKDSDRVRVSKLIVDQTLGNNDTFPTRYGANCDGVHVYDSRNVIITECDIQSTDDCIAFTQAINSSISTNYIASGNILRPYAASQFIPSAIRLSLEASITNAKISNVLIANNIIRPVGANGMYIGTAASQSSRELDEITIANNIIDGAGFNAAIQIGPNIGIELFTMSYTQFVNEAADVMVDPWPFTNLFPEM